MRHVRDNIRGRGRKVTLCEKLPKKAASLFILHVVAERSRVI